MNSARYLKWLCVLVSGACWATTRYVALDGAHVAPFTSWATAARDIQSAVNAAAGQCGVALTVSNAIGEAAHATRLDYITVMPEPAGAMLLATTAWCFHKRCQARN